MMFYLGINMQDAVITYLNIEKKISHGEVLIDSKELYMAI